MNISWKETAQHKHKNGERQTDITYFWDTQDCFLKQSISSTLNNKLRQHWLATQLSTPVAYSGLLKQREFAEMLQ